MYRVICRLFAFLAITSVAFAQLPPGVIDTQPNGDTPPSPMESLAKITVPDGFRVTLYAGEPDVHQPIDLTFDDRGRLWVVECYTYPDWEAKHRDRILIFEDEDNDGRFDTRKVFAENLSNITGIALGFGGVWACSTPELIFIPDRNHDDQPDGLAEIKLNGWNDLSDEVEHNVFNGLVWGPDGWMYGGHGILADSLVGKPRTPTKQRLRMNCGIWRFHPVTETFEVVAHGTTNPWGIDFDQYGQCFFTNSVIGHLWHLIPGARYERMYGTHFNPYTYTLIEQIADHLHWGGGSWTESRGGVGTHSEAGGGHAHVGAMIYRGGTWPNRYHGSLFTANLHGNRLNRDILRRKGSGYEATHAADFLHGNDPWFRGIDVLYGPDGNVYVSDWTDLGECHDNDGTHRSSGRIYKISYGDTKQLEKLDLAKLPGDELLEFANHQNAWYWNHALRLLHERSSRGDDLSAVIEAATKQLKNISLDSPAKLRLLNALALTGGAHRELLNDLLEDDDEHVQTWAVRQLAEADYLDNDALADFVKITPKASPKVQLEIASVLQRIPLEKRWEVVVGLLNYNRPSGDQNLLPMVWFAMEPLANSDPNQFVNLARIGADKKQLGPLRKFIAKRAVVDAPKDQKRIDRLLDVAARLRGPAQADLLDGLREGLASQRRIKRPDRWPSLASALVNAQDGRLRQVVDELSIKFGDRTTLSRLRRVANDRTADTRKRQATIKMLAENRAEGTLDLLLGLLGDAVVRNTALESLSQFNDPKVPAAILSVFPKLSINERAIAVSTLVGSRPHAKALLDAVAQGTVPSTAILPTQAAAIYQLRDDRLRKQLKKHWGDIRSSSKEKRQQIADWKATLSPKVLANADIQNGAKVYEQNCGTCHKLFGKGGDVAPDLTGSDRHNLDYILQNVVSPSAAVGKDYRLQTVLLESGLAISGALREQTPSSIVVQTAEKRVTIPRNEIASIDATELSLMPEGQFQALPKMSVRDLIAFLMSDPK